MAMIEIRRKQLDSAQRIEFRVHNWRAMPRQNYGSRVFYAIVRDGKRLDTALTLSLARKRAKRYREPGEAITEDGGIRL